MRLRCYPSVSSTVGLLEPWSMWLTKAWVSPRGSKPLLLTLTQLVKFSLPMYEERWGQRLKLWPKIVTSLPQKPLRPFSCNSFCWRLGSERIYLLSYGYMTGYGLDVRLMIRFCMLPKDMSDISFFPTLTSPPVFSRSLAYTRLGRLSSPLAHPPLTLRCLPNAHKAPDEVGEDGRLPDNFLLPNSAIDKLLSASSPATLTGLTSAPA